MAVEVLESVCWFGKAISDQTVLVAYYICIEDVTNSEEHSAVNLIVTWYVLMLLIILSIFLTMCPDSKYVIYVPPPNDRFVRRPM